MRRVKMGGMVEKIVELREEGRNLKKDDEEEKEIVGKEEGDFMKNNDDGGKLRIGNNIGKVEKNKDEVEVRLGNIDEKEEGNIIENEGKEILNVVGNGEKGIKEMMKIKRNGEWRENEKGILERLKMKRKDEMNVGR